MFSFEKHCLHGKMIECFKILNGFMNVDESKLFDISIAPELEVMVLNLV